MVDGLNREPGSRQARVLRGTLSGRLIRKPAHRRITNESAGQDLLHAIVGGRSPRRLRLGQWLIGLFILLSGAGLVWYTTLARRIGTTGRPGWPGGGPERPPVRVVQAETRSIAVALKALGTVTPVNTVTVRSRSRRRARQRALQRRPAGGAGRSWPKSIPAPTRCGWRRPKRSGPRTRRGSKTPTTDLRDFQ